MAGRRVLGLAVILGLFALAGVRLHSFATVTHPAADETTYSTLLKAAGDVGDASVVAQAAVPQVAVFASAGDATPSKTLSNPNAEGAPLVFLAVATQGGDWVEVLLPVRPNGTTGWVRRSDVHLVADPYRVEIDLGHHRITVWKGSDVFRREPVGVGARSTGTPHGLYFITELLQPPDAAGFYGPYAFGISGYSDVLKTYEGGDGQIGIHGTDDPSSFGKDVSHGCIRMSNDGITALALAVPLGTPVLIR